jgi:DNA-binding transcriptional MocR family regulator
MKARGSVANPSARWAQALSRSDKPAYLALAEIIAEDVQTGRLAAHQYLPPLRSLAGVLKLNFTTVARGYAEAQRQGLVDARPGRGTYVREIVQSGPVRRPIAAAPIDMTMNMPPEPADRALVQRLREGLAGLADDDVYGLLRYQEFGGTLHDREAGAQLLSEFVPDVTADRIVVCPGVQSALAGLFAALARAGDTVACEAITYPGIRGLTAQLGIRLVGLPADDEGIDPDAFAALCASDPPRALYCNPTLLNPTTAVMSLTRREAVVEIARRYSIPIIEDDAYAHLPARRPRSLASLAPELVFYTTGLAKILGAGLRIGYIATPNARYTARVSAALRTSVIMASPFMMRLATRFIEDGTVSLAVRVMRQETRARQKLAAEILNPRTGSASLAKLSYISKPEAFHLWLAVPPPWNRIELASHLRVMGVGVVVSDTFTVAGPPPESVRVGLGGCGTLEDCRHLLGIIVDALREHRPG